MGERWGGRRRSCLGLGEGQSRRCAMVGAQQGLCFTVSDTEGQWRVLSKRLLGGKVGSRGLHRRLLK